MTGKCHEDTLDNRRVPMHILKISKGQLRSVLNQRFANFPKNCTLVEDSFEHYKRVNTYYNVMTLFKGRMAHWPCQYSLESQRIKNNNKRMGNIVV